MPEVSFDNLLIISVIAVLAPLLAGALPKLRIPAVVLEIVAGIVVGPTGFGWVEVDLPVQILALFGLAFLLFLAGLEIDLMQLRGRLLGHRARRLRRSRSRSASPQAAHCRPPAGCSSRCSSPSRCRRPRSVSSSLSSRTPGRAPAGWPSRDRRGDGRGFRRNRHPVVLLLHVRRQRRGEGRAARGIRCDGRDDRLWWCFEPAARCGWATCWCACRTPRRRSASGCRLCCWWRSWRSRPGSDWRASSARFSPAQSSASSIATRPRIRICARSWRRSGSGSSCPCSSSAAASGSI